MLLILYQFLSPPVCQAHCQAITEGQPWMRQMISASRSVWAVLRDLHSKAIMQIIVYSKYEYIVQERGRFLWACGWEDVCVRACVWGGMCAWSEQSHLVHDHGGEWDCQLALRKGLEEKWRHLHQDEGISRYLWAWMSATNSLLRFQHLPQEITVKYPHTLKKKTLC